MAHISLIKLLKKALDEEKQLSKKFKEGLKKEIDGFPECVSFKTILNAVSGYAPLPINGKGNDSNYKTPACERQPYCDTLKELGRCNKEQCFFNSY